MANANGTKTILSKIERRDYHDSGCQSDKL